VEKRETTFVFRLFHSLSRSFALCPTTANLAEQRLFTHYKTGIPKKNDVLDVPAWRFLQHIAEIRNLCDHKLDREPTKDDVTELLEGVRRSIKTTF
jgi:hypothetical protein